MGNLSRTSADLLRARLQPTSSLAICTGGPLDGPRIAIPRRLDRAAPRWLEPALGLFSRLLRIPHRPNYAARSEFACQARWHAKVHYRAARALHSGTASGTRPPKVRHKLGVVAAVLHSFNHSPFATKQQRRGMPCASSMWQRGSQSGSRFSSG